MESRAARAVAEARVDHQGGAVAAHGAQAPAAAPHAPRGPPHPWRPRLRYCILALTLTGTCAVWAAHLCYCLLHFRIYLG